MGAPVPSIRQKAEALAGRFPPLLLAAQRVAATVSIGEHRRRRAGAGESFWQFRPYQPFDSARLVDWRRSAQGDTTFVREREFETAQSIWLWCDSSPSMDWHSERDLPTKRERAALLTIALAVLLIEAGERVGLLGEPMLPKSGKATLEPIAELLELGQSGSGLPSHEGLPRHSQLLLIGDFLDPLAETDALIRGWAQNGCSGHLLQVLDPSEESFPYEGRVQFEGLENESAELLGRAEQVRDAYISRLTRHRDGLAAMTKAIGWSFAHHHTSSSPQSALLPLHLRLSGQG